MRTEVTLAFSLHGRMAANAEGKERDAQLVSELLLATNSLEKKYYGRPLPEKGENVEQFVWKKDFTFTAADAGIDPRTPNIANFYRADIANIPVQQADKDEIASMLDDAREVGFDTDDLGLYLAVHFEGDKFSHAFDGATLARWVNEFNIRPREICLVSCNAARDSALPVMDFLQHLNFDRNNPPEVHAYHVPVFLHRDGRKLFKPKRKRGEEAVPKDRLTEHERLAYKKIFRYNIATDTWTVARQEQIPLPSTAPPQSIGPSASPADHADREGESSTPARPGSRIDTSSISQAQHPAEPQVQIPAGFPDGLRDYLGPRVKAARDNQESYTVIDMEKSNTTYLEKAKYLGKFEDRYYFLAKSGVAALTAQHVGSLASRLPANDDISPTKHYTFHIQGKGPGTGLKR